MSGVAEYDLSTDGCKLLYRTGGGGGRGRQSGSPDATPPVNLFLVDAATPPNAGQGRVNASLRMYLEPKEEFKQIFNEGWRNQRDYLYVPNTHGADWPKMKEMYGQLLPYVHHRADLNYLLDNMGAEIALAISSKPAMEGARVVTVVPVANEQTLRTRAWVESNRRLVDKLSNGQLAYVYRSSTKWLARAAISCRTCSSCARSVRWWASARGVDSCTPPTRRRSWMVDR